MKKIVGYTRQGQNFEPVYEEIQNKTNNMNMNDVINSIDTNSAEGLLLNAAMAKLTTEHSNESRPYDVVFMECYDLAVKINGDNPLPGVRKQEERLPFEAALEKLINRCSIENESDTPDFILAKYLRGCLNSYNLAVRARDSWFGVDMWTEDRRKHTPPNDTLSRVIEDLKKEQDGTKA